MGKTASFLTGLAIGGSNAFIQSKMAEKAEAKQDARDKLLRDALGVKAIAESPLGQAGDKLLDKGGDASAPGFAGTQEPAPIDTATVSKPLNAIEQANADHAEMADAFKQLTVNPSVGG